QKQNPVVLERCRAKAAHLLGSFTVASMALKGSGFMHSHDSSIDSTGQAWTASNELLALLEVMDPVFASLQVNSVRLAERSTAGFTTSTEVADYLTRHHGLPFRVAHELVSSTVR